MSTFLIAEDDPLHRGFLREVLGQCDIGTYRLVEVDNGDDAIREITDQEARGVILDLQMPRQTGVQVARWIWARSPATPILFWSNYADEAYVRGISRIVPAKSLIEEVMKSAVKISEKSAITVMAVKEAVSRAQETTLREGLLFERRLFHALFATEDQKEGMAAFLEKRQPQFRDK